MPYLRFFSEQKLCTYFVNTAKYVILYKETTVIMGYDTAFSQGTFPLYIRVMLSSESRKKCMLVP